MLSYLSACNTYGYSSQGAAAWDVAGIWSKIEDDQHQSITGANVLDSTNKWFPTDYATNPNAAKNIDSVFDQLSKWIWYKGIQYTLRWGDIEKSPGVFDWRVSDFILDTVRDLQAITGRSAAQNKKVIFLMPLKTFSLTSANDILAPDLQTTGTNYSNGATRYDLLIGYNAGYGDVVVDGYGPRLQDFMDGLTGNNANGAPIYTYRDRYYAFMTALYNRYKDHPAFGGYCNTEPVYSGFYDLTEWNQAQWMAGRLKLLQKLKEIFTRHLVADAIDVHNDWGTNNAPPTASSVLLANKIAFINPNFYTGLNLDSIYAAADELSGNVPVIHSCQGLDQDSKSGFFKRAGTQADIYDFLPTPPGYGNPRSAIENPNFNSAGTLISFDPPDLNWVIRRSIYLKTNILMYQHNYAAKGNATRTIGGNRVDRFNWSRFAIAMNANTTILSPNTGGLIQNDPAGGMVTTRPLHIAGD